MTKILHSSRFLLRIAPFSLRPLSGACFGVFLRRCTGTTRMRLEVILCRVACEESEQIVSQCTCCCLDPVWFRRLYCCNLFACWSPSKPSLTSLTYPFDMLLLLWLVKLMPVHLNKSKNRIRRPCLKSEEFTESYIIYIYIQYIYNIYKELESERVCAKRSLFAVH